MATANAARPMANLPKCIWAGRIKPIVVDDQAYEMQAKEIEKLKEEVGRMVIKIKEGTTLIEKLKLIDTLEQLGISYHFEKEIDFLLQQIFLQINADYSPQEEHSRNDLYTTALLFRLLRQHGFNISSGIFSQFLNDIGNFEESLSNDKKGLLSLYQAAHLKTHEESILEKALLFTTTHLKRGQQAMSSSSSLAKQINHALEQPLHKNVPRIEARHYISVYEEDEGKNPLLLRFAKLDYNYLQIMYRKELDELFSWCKGVEVIASKGEYPRHRLVECYFWAISHFFEPQYYLCRIICTKSLVFVSRLDDTFDTFGTLDQLQVFTDALETWDVRGIDRLPEYMKAIFVGLMNLCDWVEEELIKQEKFRPYALAKYKEEWKRYVRTNYTQSIWFLKRELPSFEDYREIAAMTSSYFLLAATSFLFLDSATEDVFANWLAGDPKILMAVSVLGRFLNDVASYQREKQQGATGPECYMKQYNVSEEEAMKKFEEIAEDTWNDINGEILRPTAVSREILMPILNCARMSEVIYKHRRDGYTYPGRVMEPHIVAVLLDLIVV